MSVRLSRGLDVKWGSLSDYYKWVCKPENAQEHPKFLAALAEYIKKVRKDGRLKLKDKKELQEAHTTLDMEEKQGGRFEKPKMQFVMTANWDEQEYGKPPEEVEEFMFGKMHKGYWRQVGKVGHFDYVYYDDKGLRQSTRVHDGEGPFAERALQAKLDAASTVMSEVAKKRESVAAEAPPPASINDVMKMLKNLGAVRSKSGATEASASEVENSGSEDAAPATSQDDDDSDDGSEKRPGVGVADRLRSLFAPAPSKGAKAVQKGNGGSVPGKVGARGVPSTSSASGSQKLSSRPKQASLPSMPPREQNREVAVLDGRARRLQSSLAEIQTEVRTEFDKIVFDEVQSVVNMSNTEKEAFSKAHTAKLKSLGKLQVICRTQLSRISSSPNKSAFGQEEETFQTLMRHVNEKSALCNLMKSASPPADEWEQAWAAMQQQGCQMSTPYVLQDLAVKTQKALMYRDYASMCRPYGAHGEVVLPVV